jgi:hypothetical protein
LKENNWEKDEYENTEREESEEYFNDLDILNELDHVTGVQPSNPNVGKRG